MPEILRPGTGPLADQLHQFFAFSPQPMLLISPAGGCILTGNEAAADLYGYALEELTDLPLDRIRPAHDGPAMRAALTEQGFRPCRPKGPGPDGTWVNWRADGSTMYVELTMTPLEWQDQQILLCQAKDVTHHLQTSHRLARLDQLLHASAFAATRTLAASSLDPVLPEVMARIGRAAGVDRVYVFETIPSPDPLPRVSQRFEWAADGVSVEIDNPHLQNLCFEDFGIPEWASALAKGESVQTLTEETPPAMRALLEEQGITAHIFVPVFVSGTWWGFIGFDQCGPPRLWEQAEVEVLRTLADLIGSALHRQRADDALRTSEHRYRTLLDAANDAIFVADAETGRFLDANRRGLELTGLTLDQLRRLHVAEIHPDDQHESVAEVFKLHAEQGGGVITEGMAQLTVRHTDGSEVPVSISSSAIELDGRRVLIGLFRDVTVQRTYEQGLRLAKEKAEEISRIKSAFLANMSHEIRTPLTSILGFAEILAEDVDGESRDFAHLIQKSGQRLMDTLNSVLDLAQLEGGSFVIRSEPVDARALVEDALTLFEAQAEAKGLVLTCDVPPAPLPVRGDQAALHRVLANLIANAIKFTHYGSVHLSVAEEGELVVLGVRDTGIGIDPTFLPHLFDEFRQESWGDGRSFEGNGLGLAISNRLVALMGGFLSVSSEKGVGSHFEVRMPRALPVTAPAVRSRHPDAVGVRTL